MTGLFMMIAVTGGQFACSLANLLWDLSGVGYALEDEFWAVALSKLQLATGRRFPIYWYIGSCCGLPHVRCKHLGIDYFCFDFSCLFIYYSLMGRAVGSACS